MYTYAHMHIYICVLAGEGAARFCRTFLDPGRWKALRRICFRGSA